MPTRTAALLLKFKDDTLATVSRGSVKRMAKKLGFNETQVLHYALARLREEMFSKPERAVSFPDKGDDGYPPLTPDQLALIARHAPKRRRKPVTSESLF